MWYRDFDELDNAATGGPRVIFRLALCPIQGQRFEGVSLNGGPISMLDRAETPALSSTKLSFSQYNNFELSFG